MITVYPDLGWNSFISVTDATAALTQIGGGAAWTALQPDEQEKLLVTSALLLTSIADISPACNFPEAQILLIQFDMVNNGAFLNFTQGQVGEYKRAKVGPLDVEYNLDSSGAGMAGGIDGLPGIVKTMLGDCLKTGNGARGFHVI